MNLLKSKLRRTGTVTAGTVLGLVGLLASATPALACHTISTPASSCVNENGTWVVQWTVENSESTRSAIVQEVNAWPDSTTSLTGIAKDDVLPKKGEGVLKATQTLPASAQRANLSVEAVWENEGGNNGVFKTTGGKRGISKPTTPCETPEPEPSESTPTSPEPSESTPTNPEPSESTPTSPEPSESTPTKPEPSGSDSPVTEPQFVYSVDCETLTVGIEVPASWEEDITVTFKPSVGEAQTIVGKRGETTTVDFPASEGLTVTATPKGYEDEAASITYEAPEDCDTSGEGGGGLAVTGAAAGGIAGGAAALLALGALLFMLARRRKVKFTA